MKTIYSSLSLKLYGMIKRGIIKSNAMFWREFFNQDKIESINIELQDVENELQEKI